MTMLDEVELRVRRTICNTWSAGKTTVEGRISLDDFDTLLNAASSTAVTLRQFRDFVCKHAKVWSIDGSHHNPIWQRVAEALDAVGLNDLPICRVCDALDRENRFAFTDLCPACAAALGGGMVTVEFGPCRVCGCTTEDCRQCIAATGSPCHWVEYDLCSACSVAAPVPLDECTMEHCPNCNGQIIFGKCACAAAAARRDVGLADDELPDPAQAAALSGSTYELDRKYPTVDWTPAELMLFLLETRRSRNWMVSDEGKVLVKSRDDGSWWHLCRTDLSDNVVTWTESTTDAEYWSDPLGKFAKSFHYGARIDINEKVIAVVDALTDG
jgi:hypothetical protein